MSTKMFTNISKKCFKIFEKKFLKIFQKIAVPDPALLGFISIYIN